MIDESKFEKLEKEDMQKASGGVSTPSVTEFGCPLCGNKTLWQGYYTDDRSDVPKCTRHDSPVKMQVHKYYYN